MNWDQINKTQSVVDYQCHTMTHPLLGNIDLEEDLEFELNASVRLLEKRIGRSINYISYPVGSYTSKTLVHVKKTYKAGFAVDSQLVSLQRLTKEELYRYKIPRFNVSDENPYELFFRVNGFHKLFKR